MRLLRLQPNVAINTLRNRTQPHAVRQWQSLPPYLPIALTQRRHSLAEPQHICGI